VSQNKLTCILTVYVDDILLTGNEHEIKNTKNLLKKHFNITDVGNVNTIIGIKFEKEKDGYLLQQRRYVENILDKYDRNKYKISSNMIPDKMKSWERKNLISQDINKL